MVTVEDLLDLGFEDKGFMQDQDLHYRSLSVDYNDHYIHFMFSVDGKINVLVNDRELQTVPTKEQLRVMINVFSNG